MGKASQTRANGIKTRGQILDAAEIEFGDRGFDLVTLRDITERAGVTLALATYHFGTKLNLFEQVVARRAALLCAQRQERLQALPDEADLRALLDAFLGPLFDHMKSGEPGWDSYTQVVARLSEGDRWLDILAEHFDETARLFHARLIRALPQADPNEMARALTMVLQLMLMTASGHKRLDRLTDGSVQAKDYVAAYATLLDFAEAGLRSLARTSP